MSIGFNIKKLRKHCGMTQSELAKNVSALLPKKNEIGQSVISRLEITDARTSEYIPEIAKALGISIDTLFDEKAIDRIVENGATPSHFKNETLVKIPVFPIELAEAGKELDIKKAIGFQGTNNRSNMDLKNAYWVQLDDNDYSCLPYYPPGTLFLIQASPMKYKIGDLVLAKLLEPPTRVMFYKRPTVSAYHLESINSDFASLDMVDETRSYIIGKISHALVCFE